MKNEKLVLLEPKFKSELKSNQLLQKRTISELSDAELIGIDGGDTTINWGSTYACSNCLPNFNISVINK